MGKEVIVKLIRSFFLLVIVATTPLTVGMSTTAWGATVVMPVDNGDFERGSFNICNIPGWEVTQGPPAGIFQPINSILIPTSGTQTAYSNGPTLVQDLGVTVLVTGQISFSVGLRAAVSSVFSKQMALSLLKQNSTASSPGAALGLLISCSSLTPLLR